MQDRKWLNDVELVGKSVTLTSLARGHTDVLVDVIAVVFSLINQEWLAVKKNLLFKLGR